MRLDCSLCIAAMSLHASMTSHPSVYSGKLLYHCTVSMKRNAHIPMLTYALCCQVIVTVLPVVVAASGLYCSTTKPFLRAGAGPCSRKQVDSAIRMGVQIMTLLQKAVHVALRARVTAQYAGLAAKGLLCTIDRGQTSYATTV
jgi:hypothetical protein